MTQDDPWAVARVAMGAAAVQVRRLESLAEMTAACRLLDDVWDIPPGETSEVRPSLLRALGHADNYLAGAYRVDEPDSGELVAASVGFFGAPSAATLHSHITGVLPGSGPGVGRAIKWHQRAWALDRGLRRITWTYDPLIARNAFFNVTRLGARPCHYLTDFYGPMDDGPNRGQPTDRADIEWELLSGPVVRASSAVLDGSGGSDGPDVEALRAAGATVALAVDRDGEPAGGVVEKLFVRTVGEPVVGPVGEPVVGGPADVVVVGIPADIEAIRRRDQALALRWRLALRSVLVPLLSDRSAVEDAWRVTGFAKSGWYVLERAGTAREGGHR